MTRPAYQTVKDRANWHGLTETCKENVQDIQRQYIFLQSKYNEVMAIKYCQPTLTKQIMLLK